MMWERRELKKIYKSVRSNTLIIELLWGKTRSDCLEVNLSA